MILNLKPATALVFLLNASPLSLTAAERSRRGRLLNEQKGGTVNLLALNAEFHRAIMMLGISSSAVGADGDKLMLRGSVQAQQQTASKKFAAQPRIQRLLANIRRKRALKGPVQRSAGEGTIRVDALNEYDLVECTLDDAADMEQLLDEGSDDADVGLLRRRSHCDDGYACVPSDASKLGGLCKPTGVEEATSSATTRKLDGYCPSGCPVKVCECEENYWADSQACYDAFLGACRDDSYVDHCSETFGYMTYPYEKEHGAVFCNFDVCLDNYGLLGTSTADSLCDRTDTRCEACYCTMYASYCRIFSPICAQGSDATPCGTIDEYCERGAECIDDVTLGNLKEEDSGESKEEEAGTPENFIVSEECTSEIEALFENKDFVVAVNDFSTQCNAVSTSGTIDTGIDLVLDFAGCDTTVLDQACIDAGGKLVTIQALFCKGMEVTVSIKEYTDCGGISCPSHFQSEAIKQLEDETGLSCAVAPSPTPTEGLLTEGPKEAEPELPEKDCGSDPSSGLLCDVIEGCPPDWAVCIPELQEIRTTTSPGKSYVYQRPATCFITDIFYYFNDLSKEWFWTPYRLADEVWIPVSTLTVPSGFWYGQIPAPPNVQIITFLNEEIPDPTSSCGAIDSDRSDEDAPTRRFPTCEDIPSRSGDPFLFDATVYDLSLQALYLSNLVYQENPWPISSGSKYQFAEAAYNKDYEFVIRGSYESADKLDQALVAESNGRCFGIYRGTIAPFDKTNNWLTRVKDWSSNAFPLGVDKICGECGCCEGRESFLEIFNNDFRDEFLRELLDCAQHYCTDPHDCLVLGGHSQGGAVAEVAAVYLGHLDPWLFTFGRPNAMRNPCPILKNLRHYNFCNTIKENDSRRGNTMVIRHDPVFFLPAGASDLWDKAGDFGHNIFLSGEPTVATKLDVSDDLFLHPIDFTKAGRAHAPIDGDNPLMGEQSYFEHLNGLAFDKYTMSIPSDGWGAGSMCLFDEQCISQKCVAQKLRVPCKRVTHYNTNVSECTCKPQIVSDFVA